MNLLRSGRGGRDGQRGQTEDRDEPRGTHTPIVNPSRSFRGRAIAPGRARIVIPAGKLVIPDRANPRSGSVLRAACDLQFCRPCAEPLSPFSPFSPSSGAAEEAAHRQSLRPRVRPRAFYRARRSTPSTGRQRRTSRSGLADGSRSRPMAAGCFRSTWAAFRPIPPSLTDGIGRRASDTDGGQWLARARLDDSLELRSPGVRRDVPDVERAAAALDLAAGTRHPGRSDGLPQHLRPDLLSDRRAAHRRGNGAAEGPPDRGPGVPHRQHVHGLRLGRDRASGGRRTRQHAPRRAR